LYKYHTAKTMNKKAKAPLAPRRPKVRTSLDLGICREGQSDETARSVKRSGKLCTLAEIPVVDFDRVEIRFSGQAGMLRDDTLNRESARITRNIVNCGVTVALIEQPET
jgi:hypothetical protein